MSTYKIEGKIAIVVENKKIAKVKLRPDRKYISPDHKYAICIEEKNGLKAKLLLLTDDKISLVFEKNSSLSSNNLLQNIALQELVAIFYIEKDKKESYKIVKFEYPRSL